MELHPIAQQADYFKILVYGAPDAGKTTFATSGHSHEAFSKTLVCNIERGLSSVRWTNALQTPLINSMAMMDEVVMGVQNGTGDFEGIKTLVVDSVTELQRVALDEIVRERVQGKGSADKPQLADYGDLTKFTRRMGGLLRDLPCNVIMIALERHKQDGDGPVTSIGPDMTAKACGSLMAMFDNVWYLRKKLPSAPTKDEPAGAVYVVMLTQAAGLYAARTRVPEFGELLPAVVTNPTLPMIHDIYIKSLEAGRKKAESNGQ